MFEGIIGHEKILRILEKTVANPAPGYGFYGPSGAGKRTIARAFIAKLIGADLLHLDAHPDFIRLEREEGAREIKIKQTREAIGRLFLSSAAGGWKALLVDDAHRLNEESANALLKSVEEPSAKTISFFITDRPDRLPATLRSRLVMIPFGSAGFPGRAKTRELDPETYAEREARVRSLLETVLHGPLGKGLGEIERLAKTAASSEDPERFWQSELDELARCSAGVLSSNPDLHARFGRGISLAWSWIGSGLSPHLALEWALIEPYTKGDLSIPSFLQPSYL